MKFKKLSASILIGAMLIAVPVFARGGGHGKGYMGGRNADYSQQSGSQSYKGYGDGTMPRPMDGTGFGAKNSRANSANKGQGKRLRDGSCLNSTTVTQ